MSKRGNLAKIDFAKLLTWIHSQRLSGTLRVSQGSKSKFVLIEQGEIMSAYSEFPEDSFRSVIMRMKLLPETQQTDLNLESDASDGAFAKRLIEKGYITEREFLEVLRRQNLDILMSLFEWRRGEFVLYQDKFPETKTISLKFPFDALIAKGLKHAHQRREMDNHVPSDAIFQVVDPEYREKKIKKHNDLAVRKVFSCLSEPKKIRDIVSETGLTEFEVVSTLLIYIDSGAIKAIAPETPVITMEVKRLMADAEIAFSKKLYWEAWVKAKAALSKAPSHPRILEIYKRCAEEFKKDLHKVIGSSNRIPKIVGSLDDSVYKKFPRDSALGFLLSRIDGKSNISDMGKILQIEREKLYVTLYLLVRSGVVELVERKGPGPEEIAGRRKYVRDLWEKMQKQNYYELLGVGFDADETEIKNAYFRLVKQYHPDTRASDEPQDIKDKLDEIFVRIKGAYQTLINEDRRQEYNARLPDYQSANKNDIVKTKTKAQLQFLVGLKSFQAREYRRAMEYFRSAIDLDPYEPKYYSKLAEVCCKNPQWYRAGMLAIRKAIQLDPEDSTFYSIFGSLYKLDGNFVEAEKQFRKALQLDPENLTARQELTAMGKSVSQPGADKKKQTKFTPMLKKKKKYNF